MAFNELQYDEDTKRRMNTYENIMGNYSRFWVQLIAKENGIKFKWGVTAKETVIRMMSEEDVKIPTKEDLARYLSNHRNRFQESNKEDKKQNNIIKEVIIDDGCDDFSEEVVDGDEEEEFAEEVIEDKQAEPDIEKMKRGELVKLAFSLNLPSPMNKSNVELINLIKEIK